MNKHEKISLLSRMQLPFILEALDIRLQPRWEDPLPHIHILPHTPHYWTDFIILCIFCELLSGKEEHLTLV